MSGAGTIWSFVVPHPPLLPAYAELAPYNVIVVALDEDPTIRFVGNLVAGPDGPINEIDPATIAIGEPVEVVFSPGRRRHPPPLDPATLVRTADRPADAASAADRPAETRTEPGRRGDRVGLRR